MTEFRLIDPTEIEEAAALSLVVALRRDARPAEVAEYVANATTSVIDLANQTVAVDGRRLVGTLLFVPIGAGTVTLGAPSILDSSEKTAAGLVVRTVELCRLRGDRTLQFIAEKEQSADAFVACGFQLLATLLCLERYPRTGDDVASTGRFSHQTFSAQSSEDFARTIRRTFEGTLDCKRLPRSEELDRDVLAIYRSPTAFDPGLWFLARDGEQIVGCLLLSRCPERGCFEISYVGVVPECRGKGFGAELVRRGIAECAARNRNWPLRLAVDRENSPAVAIYHRLGFRSMGTKSVYVRILA